MGPAGRDVVDVVEVLAVIPGIDPRVDIAFKKVFGSPAWTGLTISLIDAVLRPGPGRHLVRLDLLNPYSEQETPSDKLSVLDIKAQDERGRWFNVEMQMHLGRALAPRLLYYWARLYGAQLVEGDEYDQLRQTISICFLNQTMFHQREAYHSVFGLWERTRQLCLTEHLEIHLLEIPKFHRAVEALREPLDFWLYFLQNGKELDADALPSRLARPEIQQAMEVLSCGQFSSAGSGHSAAHSTARQAASGRRAHQMCSVEICPCRIDFSRRAWVEIALIGRSTSMRRRG